MNGLRISSRRINFVSSKPFSFAFKVKLATYEYSNWLSLSLRSHLTSSAQISSPTTYRSSMMNMDDNKISPFKEATRGKGKYFHKKTFLAAPASPTARQRLFSEQTSRITWRGGKRKSSSEEFDFLQPHKIFNFFCLLPHDVRRRNEIFHHSYYALESWLFIFHINLPETKLKLFLSLCGSISWFVQWMGKKFFHSSHCTRPP